MLENSITRFDFYMLDSSLCLSETSTTIICKFCRQNMLLCVYYLLFIYYCVYYLLLEFKCYFVCHIAYHNCIFFWEYIKFTCILQALEKADNAETSAVESSGKVKGALDAVTKILETLGELYIIIFFTVLLQTQKTFVIVAYWKALCVKCLLKFNLHEMIYFIMIFNWQINYPKSAIMSERPHTTRF